jgi:hypothetical protein
MTDEQYRVFKRNTSMDLGAQCITAWSIGVVAPKHGKRPLREPWSACARNQPEIINLSTQLVARGREALRKVMAVSGHVFLQF